MTLKQAIEDTLADVRQWSAYTLADTADCSAPDTRESEGALFLTHVRDATVELIEPNVDDIEDEAWFETINDDGSVSQIADDAPSIYTYTAWKEFVDLGAFNEDPTELGFDGSEMDKAAGICLYIIAERLAYAILNHVREVVEQYEDDQDNE